MSTAEKIARRAIRKVIHRRAKDDIPLPTRVTRSMSAASSTPSATKPPRATRVARVKDDGPTPPRVTRSMSVTSSTPLATETQPPLAARFTAHLATVVNPSIRLLREPTVVQWLTGDVSFLDAIVAPVPAPLRRKTERMKKAELKQTENVWGRAILRARRPDLKLDKQWTNKFGEHICEELYTLLGARVTKPNVRNRYQPDGETEAEILEAKAQTFYTPGTAGEKILGVPFKYAEVPRLYGKPLRVICMGGAEQVCRKSYGNLPGSRTSAEKQKFLDFFKEMGVTFIATTTLLESILPVAE